MKAIFTKNLSQERFKNLVYVFLQLSQEEGVIMDRLIVRLTVAARVT